MGRGDSETWIKKQEELLGSSMPLPTMLVMMSYCWSSYRSSIVSLAVFIFGRRRSSSSTSPSLSLSLLQANRNQNGGGWVAVLIVIGTGSLVCCLPPTNCVTSAY